MMEASFYIILLIAAIYLVIGIFFAIPFVLKWVEQIDTSAVQSHWTFRLLIIPGVIVFWPVLFRRLIKLKKDGN
jgi:hypothetical protein